MARPSPFERHPRLTIAILFSVAVVGTDLAFTWTYNRLLPRPNAAPSFRIRSELYHHGFRPGSDVGLDHWGPRAARYYIDDLGLRDRAVRSVPLHSERPRLLFVGDSFTEGIGVDWEHTFVGRIAQELEPRGVEVLNAGCASYCPIIDERRVRHLLEEVGLRFDELVVFVDIGDIQDEVTYDLDAAGNVVGNELRRVREDRENQRFGLPPLLQDLGLKRSLRRNSLLLSTLLGAVEARMKPGGVQQRAGLWTVDRSLLDAYGREGLERARASMDRLASLLERHGVRLTVAVYPWPDQILRGDLHSLQVRTWSDWSAAHGAGFLDCFPRFVGQGDPRQVVATQFIPGDIHWNEAGHAVIARAFLDHLEERGGVATISAIRGR